MHPIMFAILALFLYFCVTVIALGGGFLLHFFNFQETWMYAVQAITSLFSILPLLARMYYHDREIDTLFFENERLKADKEKKDELLAVYSSLAPSLPDVLSSEAYKSLFIILGSPHLVLKFFSSWLLRKDMILGACAWLKEELVKGETIEDAIVEPLGIDDVNISYEEVRRLASGYHKRNMTTSEITQALQVFEAYITKKKARDDFLCDDASRH